jgi:hypothetical protein
MIRPVVRELLTHQDSREAAIEGEFDKSPTSICASKLMGDPGTPFATGGHRMSMSDRWSIQNEVAR